MTEPDILYTTLARVVAPLSDAGSGAPKSGSGRDQGRGRGQGDGAGGGDSKRKRALRARGGAGAGAPAGNGSDAAAAVRAAVDAMSASLCGLQATLPELWCAAIGVVMAALLINCLHLGPHRSGRMLEWWGARCGGGCSSACAPALAGMRPHAAWCAPARCPLTCGVPGVSSFTRSCRRSPTPLHA